ncbi:MAG: ribonuclease III [Lachnospiraceae bacterium]|nr:ribonuclease III [Lachnospiraceae bacterium]
MDHIVSYDFTALEETIGYHFSDAALLRTALTHRSFANEIKAGDAENNERLEFLGDAVLEVSVSEFLYRKYPEMREGDMTKLRAALVCESTLAGLARDIHLNDFLLLGRGEELSGSRERDSLISDCLEALIGALYLDGGQEEAARFIRSNLLEDMEHKALFFDAKTQLQMLVQKDGRELSYRVIKEEGPGHDKHFTVEALIDGHAVSEGAGSSKKQAEQQAAANYLNNRKE